MKVSSKINVGIIALCFVNGLSFVKKTFSVTRRVVLSDSLEDGGDA